MSHNLRPPTPLECTLHLAALVVILETRHQCESAPASNALARVVYPNARGIMLYALISATVRKAALGEPLYSSMEEGIKIGLTSIILFEAPGKITTLIAKEAKAAVRDTARLLGALFSF